MKKNALILGLVAIVALIYIKFKEHRESSPLNPTETTETQETVEAGSPTPDATALPSSPGSSSESAQALAVPPQDEVSFENRLLDLATCLQLRDIQVNEEAEGMDFFSLNASLAAKFGGLRDQDDLWSATELQTPEGVRRRIVIDFRPGQPALRYIEMQKDGSQKDLELSTEQSSTPSETLIASLESDGQIIGRTREREVTYVYGQKMHLREVDGKISSMRLVQGPRSYSCSRDAQLKLNCTCAGASPQTEERF